VNPAAAALSLIAQIHLWLQQPISSQHEAHGHRSLVLESQSHQRHQLRYTTGTQIHIQCVQVIRRSSVRNCPAAIGVHLCLAHRRPAVLPEALVRHEHCTVRVSQVGEKAKHAVRRFEEVEPQPEQGSSSSGGGCSTVPPLHICYIPSHTRYIISIIGAVPGPAGCWPLVVSAP